MSYQIGDIIYIQGIEYTVWLIEGNLYHIKDANEHGFCCDEEWINVMKD
jgi:hypothetical protein